MHNIVLSSELRLKMVQALEICGGATESIFPQIEVLLLHFSDFEEALQFVAAKKNMNKYRSMMDFLFCEIFIDYKRSCFQYYLDHKTSLKDMITPTQLVEFTWTLARALEVAYDKFTEQRRISWTDFRRETLRKAAA